MSLANAHTITTLTTVCRAPGDQNHRKARKPPTRCTCGTEYKRWSLGPNLSVTQAPTFDPNCMSSFRGVVNNLEIVPGASWLTCANLHLNRVR